MSAGRKFRAALNRIGVSRALVVGHSWGASVAVALALRHPGVVSGLVLASGYYYPSARVDMALLSVPAVPLLGDLQRYTIAPIASRLIWPLLMRTIFGPAPVPPKFRRFPKETAVRAGCRSARQPPNRRCWFPQRPRRLPTMPG